MKGKYGKLTGIIWLNEMSSWIHIEDGIPQAVYNSLYDFMNRIAIASPEIWEEKWNMATSVLKSQMSTEIENA